MKTNDLSIYLLLLLMCFVCSCSNKSEAKDYVNSADEKLYVFLCLGQSNMEGHARVESIDTIDVSERLLVMQAIDCPNRNYQKGEWRKAIPPMVRCYTGLSPADYFGRTLIDSLPDNIRIGIVNVAVGGCRIELFDKDNYQSYVETSADWLKNMVDEYDGNPYEQLISLAKKAQLDGGEIKGVLLHQGESNSGEKEWPLKVKKVYDEILADLSLPTNSVPLLAGEMVSEEQNGACYGMNEIINTLPQYIENAYVISSKGCEGIDDRLHFSAQGYRELGRRYGNQMLQILNN